MAATQPAAPTEASQPPEQHAEIGMMHWDCTPAAEARPPSQAPPQHAAPATAPQSAASGSGSSAERLVPGVRVKCRFAKEGVYYLAEILDKKPGQRPDSWRYYVHYVDFNRRMDEWVDEDRLDVSTIEQGKELAPTAVPMDVLDPELSERKLTRNMKRRIDEVNPTEKGADDISDPVLAALEKEHEENTKVKNIHRIIFGKYDIECWYFSPYPEGYNNVECLYICEFCLKYMKKEKSLLKHKAKCKRDRPPGEEIYKDDKLALFEIDGKEEKVYCQNVCLIAKLFLDHKTLYYDVEPFLFYVLCEHDEEGFHIAGYFSKEKASPEEYNLACIMTLPPYQRKGYGKFLISCSYEISKLEGRAGTPERPLSDLGQLSYRSYWKQVLLEYLLKFRGNISIGDLSTLTAIKAEDIISTFKSMNIVKYLKGQHVISVVPKQIEEYLRGCRPMCRVDPTRIRYKPKFIVAPRAPSDTRRRTHAPAPPPPPLPPSPPPPRPPALIEAKESTQRTRSHTSTTARTAPSKSAMPRKLRIALLSWESLHSVAVGGVAAHVTEVGAALARKGHEVHIFVRIGQGQKPYEVIHDVHYHRVTMTLDSDFCKEMNALCNAMMWSIGETEAYQNAQFDIVHGHDWMTVKALVQAANTGHNTVLTIHSTEYGRCGNVYYPQGQSATIRSWEGEGIHKASRVICVSGALCDEVKSHYHVSGEKLRCVYNGINVHRYDGWIDPGPVKLQWGVGPMEPMVLFVGRLTAQKGPDLLLEAVPMVLKARGDAKFVFVGDGDMKQQLANRANELGVGGSVRFLGAMSNSDPRLINLYKSCDCVCMPSRNEPFGIVMLECWAAGKPLVATRQGGPGELVSHGQDGWQCEISADSLAWGICQVFQNFVHARWMGEQGRAKAAFSFSWDRIADHTLGVYGDVVPLD
eukprot:tig00021582_g22609.t1